MKRIILSVCVILFLSSCMEESKSAQNFDYGKIENEVYTNEFFDFEVSINQNWSAQTQEQMAEMAKKGQEMYGGKNQEIQKTLRPSDVNVANLLAVFEFPVGSVQVINPSLVITAENLQSFPKVKASADYMTSVRKRLDKSSLLMMYIKDPYPKTIGGAEFLGMEIYNQDYNITQEYFATLRNGFAISIVIAYDTDDQKESLYKMIDNLKFK